MAFRSISGSKIVGQGRPQPVPIQLDPSPYEGAVAYGADGLIYVSNGTTWNAVGAGIQGTGGVQGDTGIQGSVGQYGGVTFEYDFSTAVTAEINKQLLTQPFQVQLLAKVLLIMQTTSFGFMMEQRGLKVVLKVSKDLLVDKVEVVLKDQQDKRIQGIQGIQGLKGDTGVAGIQGIQGIQGDIGRTGRTRCSGRTRSPRLTR